MSLFLNLWCLAIACQSLSSSSCYLFMYLKQPWYFFQLLYYLPFVSHVRSPLGKGNISVPRISKTLLVINSNRILTVTYLVNDQTPDPDDGGCPYVCCEYYSEIPAIPLCLRKLWYTAL